MKNRSIDLVTAVRRRAAVPVTAMFLGIAEIAGVATGMTPASPPIIGGGGEEASDSIQARIDALRQEIDQYRVDRDEHWRDASRALEMRRLVSDVLADADARTSFESTPFTAGWDRGFQIRSEDGDFLLRLSGEMQVRYVVNHREGDEAVPQSPPAVAAQNPPGTLWGMENRRTRFRATGHIGDPRIEYCAQLGFRAAGGSGFLELAFLRFLLDDGWNLQVGQFRPRFLREFTVTAVNQLAVERSVVAAYFNPGFVQGAQLQWQSDQWRATAWSGDGLGVPGLQNSPWQRTPVTWAAFGRVEWKPAGEWGQFNSFSSSPGSAFGVMVGLDLAGQRLNDEIPGLDGTRQWTASGDVSIVWSGASLMASLIWQRSDGESRESAEPWGVVGQIGRFVAEDLEVFGRYSYLEADSPALPAPNQGRWNGFTLGANLHVGPQIKLSADAGIDFASLSDTAFVGNGAGLRVDEPGQRHQWLLRMQLQLLY